MNLFEKVATGIAYAIALPIGAVVFVGTLALTTTASISTNAYVAYLSHKYGIKKPSVGFSSELIDGNALGIYDYENNHIDLFLFNANIKHTVRHEFRHAMQFQKMEYMAKAEIKHVKQYSVRVIESDAELFANGEELHLTALEMLVATNVVHWQHISQSPHPELFPEAAASFKEEQEEVMAG